MNKPKPSHRIVLAPWEIVDRSRYIIVSRDKRLSLKHNICKVYNARGGELEAEALGHAILISAAPQLFRAVQDLGGWILAYKNTGRELPQGAEDSLLKASDLLQSIKGEGEVLDELS